MLIVTNNDVPKVIGNIGNILGDNNINIAGFHLGRLSEKGGKAISIINIDSAPTDKALDELRRAKNVLDVRSVTL